VPVGARQTGIIAPVPREPSDELPDQLAATPDFLGQWRDQQRAAIPDPPETLYHYTSSPALISILSSRALWATNAVYTNDQTEVVHSVEMLKRIIDAKLEDRDMDVATDMMLIAADEFYSIVEIYIVCFCRIGDLLSQWRAYGQPGGYALGFDSKVLKSLTGDHVMLVPAVYDEKKQENLTRDLIKRWREMFKGARSEQFPRHVRRLGAFVFAQAFLFLAATFKNRAFEEEDEWRLVYRHQIVIEDGSGIKLDFRERKGMVASYATLQLPAPTQQVLPIRRIVVGPTANAGLAIFGLTGFLKSVGYPDEAVQISPSVVPLRP
jgi:Protein of unknown function (DUF2971)